MLADEELHLWHQNMQRLADEPARTDRIAEYCPWTLGWTRFYLRLSGLTPPEYSPCQSFAANCGA
jgi:hypothetical protein